jgi:hypothetical protein
MFVAKCNFPHSIGLTLDFTTAGVLSIAEN